MIRSRLQFAISYLQIFQDISNVYNLYFVLLLFVKPSITEHIAVNYVNFNIYTEGELVRNSFISS